MPRKKSKARERKDRVFHEVFSDPPPQVKHTKRKKGAKAAHRQKVAIALDKLRRRK